MNETHFSQISREQKIREPQVREVVRLLEEGATVPFIARYRKEATGSLDEVAITSIRDRFDQLVDLDKRREAILKSIEASGRLTEELKEQDSCRRDDGDSGRHLSAVQAEAPDTRYHRSRQRAWSLSQS